MQELLIGAVIGFGTAFILRRMYSGNVNTTRIIQQSPLIVKYVLNFLKELTFANLDVAKRVVLPNAEINPDVIEYELDMKSPIGITVLANSITLTPGTLTMDYNEERNSFYIHAINGKGNRDEVVEPIKRWEKMLKQIVGETQ